MRLPADSPEVQGDSLRAQRLRDRGVYLITGGTGGIGLAVARYLARACRARLVLTRRSAFPEKSEWRQRLASDSLSDSDERIVRELLEIEALGGNVEVYVCDATDRPGMQRVVRETLLKHEAIHGVIHAAGILRDGLVQLKTREVAHSVLAPKVDGTFVLLDLLEQTSPDFMILFSSISSVVAFHGQSDYRGANAFLDAFSYYSNSLGRVRTVTVNWPAWKEVGILANLETPPGLEAWKQARLDKAIRTEDGLEVFRRVLPCNLPQIVVSPEDLGEWIEDTAGNLDLARPAATVAARPGASSRGEAEAPLDELEAAVAGIWGEVLGIAPIGVHETFFDLGGHSLLAMQIVSRVRNAYQINFTLRNFFDRPTVAGVSRTIRTAVTSEIENMTDDQVSRLLSRG